MIHRIAKAPDFCCGMSLMNAQDVVDYGSLLDNHPDLLSLAIESDD
jgi:hypothetical protein